MKSLVNGLQAHSVQYTDKKNISHLYIETTVVSWHKPIDNIS